MNDGKMNDGKMYEGVWKLYRECEEAKKKRFDDLPRSFKKIALEHYEKYVEEKKKELERGLKNTYGKEMTPEDIKKLDEKLKLMKERIPFVEEMFAEKQKEVEEKEREIKEKNNLK